MAANIRRATVYDLLQMQECSQTCIHERDAFLVQRFQISLLLFPQVQWVAVGPKGRILGYVTVDVEERERIAYVRSIAVLRPYRRRGLATSLLNSAHFGLVQIYDAECAEVSVRQSDNVALNFFSNVRLGYAEHGLRNLDHEDDDGEPFRVLRKLLRVRQDRQDDEDDQPRPGADGDGGHPGDEEVGPANHEPENLGLEWLFI